MLQISRKEVVYTTQQELFGNPKHKLLQEVDDRKELNYKRTERKVLGKTINRYDLPNYTKSKDFKFGVHSTKSENVKTIINPEVEPETPEVRELYIKSHHSYKEGQQLTRNYKWTKQTKDSVFGCVLKQSGDGELVKESLTWIQEEEKLRGTKIVAKRVTAVRERLQNELGKVHDPIADTMAHVPKDYSFGVRLQTDPTTAAELIGYGSAKFEDKGPQLTDKINNLPFQPVDESLPFNGVSTTQSNRACLPSRLDQEIAVDGISSKDLVCPTPYNLHGDHFLELLQKHYERLKEQQH